MKIARPLVVPVLVAALVAALLVAAFAAWRALRTPDRSDIRITQLSTEYAVNPLGIDAAKPRLGWKLESASRGQSQSAYEIRVATSPAKLDTPDVWQSGKIASGESALVTYGGPSLQSRARYYWSVRVWDAKDRPTAWSDAGWWEMGLLSDADWKAQWIGHDQPLPLPPAYGRPDDPSELKAGDTQGQAFTVITPVKSVSILVPTFQTADSSLTLTLYREGPEGASVATRRYVNIRDGDWLTLTASSPLAPGRYYLEASDVSGKVGWWTSKGHDYDFGTAYANRKPIAGFRKLRLDGAVPATTRDFNPRLRQTFTAPKAVRSARLYASALGLYTARINGKPVGDALFAPGWTDYKRRVQYQTYDVTALLQAGKNTLAVQLAPGWYAGHVGAYGIGQYGLMPAARLQLEIAYEDGTCDTIVTDQNWKSHVGPFIQADLVMGESYDAREDHDGWDRSDFDDAGWQPVRIKQNVRAKMVAQVDPPVRAVQDLTPIAVRRTISGAYVYDMGQNMVGTIRLRATGRAGQVLTIRHAEVLDRDGALYTANLRSAKAIDTYTMKGGGEETYAPTFTFHGFRYVEISGGSTQPEIVGRVMHTDAPMTLRFSTGVTMLDRLQRNITWGQRGNFLSVPMDTPARDERLGWTGDIAAFAGTAVYNMALATFLDKWLVDLRDTQSADGEYAAIAPIGDTMAVDKAAPGWGDAGVIVPWTVFEQYGDRRVLAENFDAMTRWLAFLDKNSTNGLRPATGYGDWLNLDDDTPKDLVATAYFANSAAIVAKAAAVLGKDAKPYDAVFERARNAFQRAFVEADGRLRGDTQTAYVLALTMDLIPAEARKAAANRLVERIRQRDWHLSTGFLGTPRVLEALSANGHAEAAYRVLLQTSYPSWGYQIEHGATTMWEHWDSIRPDGTFLDPNMNSFNHYAFGAVGQWMYQNIAGIRLDTPGFRSIVIRPLPSESVSKAEGRYESPYGPIESRWKVENGLFDIHVSIPVNTTAEVWVPVREGQKVNADGAERVRATEGFTIYRVGSGTYHLFTGR